MAAIELIIIIALSGLALVFVLYQAFASHKWHREHRENEISTGNEHFYGYLFYFNPDDDRILVPKWSGGGYTLNYARSSSWVITIISVGLITALFLFY